MFFVPCDKSKSLSLLRDFLNRHIVVFFETSVLKEVRYFTLSPQQQCIANNNAKFQNKVYLYYTYTDLNNFRS